MTTKVSSVDDIIVGIANRGEMATSASNTSQGGAPHTAPTDPSLVTQHLSGEYQLETSRRRQSVSPTIHSLRHSRSPIRCVQQSGLSASTL
ncbi:MAG: hypothetical protein U0936_06705 [Planctomycetaceae bacterium]